MVGLGVFYNNVEGVHYLRFKDQEGLLYPVVYPDERILETSYSDTLYGYVETVILSKMDQQKTILRLSWYIQVVFKLAHLVIAFL